MSMLEDSLAPRTQFDVNFRVGDIAVRVHPYFWLSTVFLGLDTRREGRDIFIYLLAWAAVEFVSILVHELGHVLMGRFFGSRGHILLTGMCGLAIGSAELRERWQRNLVSLAGPAAGFLLAALVLGVVRLKSPGLALILIGQLFHVAVAVGPDLIIPSELVWFILYNTLWINIFWGLVNLLAIWPLDGGQISREACQAYRGRDGVRLSLRISVLTAGAFAIVAVIETITEKPLVPWLSLGGWFCVLFFGLLAYNSWQHLQMLSRAGLDWEEREPEPRAPWERDADWWKR